MLTRNIALQGFIFPPNAHDKTLPPDLRKKGYCPDTCPQTKVTLPHCVSRWPPRNSNAFRAPSTSLSAASSPQLFCNMTNCTTPSPPIPIKNVGFSRSRPLGVAGRGGVAVRRSFSRELNSMCGACGRGTGSAGAGGGVSRATANEPASGFQGRGSIGGVRFCK